MLSKECAIHVAGRNDINLIVTSIYVLNSIHFSLILSIKSDKCVRHLTQYFRNTVPSKSSLTICKIYKIIYSHIIQVIPPMLSVFSKNWCWVSNNMDRRPGPTFRSIHIVCKGHLRIKHVLKLWEIILFCSKNFWRALYMYRYGLNKLLMTNQFNI